MSATKAPEALTPEQIVADAEREVQEAESLAQTLEERVLDGDETVSYEQIEKARGLKRFAELRKIPAEKKAAALAQKLADEKYERETREHLAAFAALEGQIEPLLEEAARQVQKAIQVALQQDKHVIALGYLAKTPGNPYHRDDEPDLVGEVPRTGTTPETARPSERFAWFRAGNLEGKIVTSEMVIEAFLDRVKK